MKLEQKAQQFATEVHKRQFRKDNKTPYITHPREVVRLLKRIGIQNEDTLCAAWLHDTIEDCDIKREIIKREFNLNVARIVSALTRDVNRERYLDRIKNADYSVQIIKIADVIHNTSLSSLFHDGIKQKTIDRAVNDCRKLYLGLAEKIELRFYEKLVKNLQPWI